MNIALIFAGGVGSRMKTAGKPKQFLEIYNKPIIIYTIEKFQYANDVDSIVVVSHPDYLSYMNQLLLKFNLTKVKEVIAGGKTSKNSIYNGLKYIKNNYSISDKDIVLIHDGVRPMITESIISKNIKAVKKHGSAVTASEAIETICIKDEENNVIDKMIERKKCLIAKAPQSFFVNEIYSAFNKIIDNDEYNFIDCATLLWHQGKKVHYILGSNSNIKVTTPSDYYVLKGIISAEESFHAFGFKLQD